MSYAEHFFGTKQNQILQYAENLAFFGEESYVYKNAGLMNEIIENEIALLNPTTAFYAYMWARENGYKAIDKFNVGLVIALYHSELNMTFHFVLIKFNDDGSAVFINREPCITGAATTSHGLDTLNYEDYDLVNYLNGEKNWFEKWENKPESITVTVSAENNPYRYLRYTNGFLSGIDTRVKKLLKTFKEGHNFPILPISYDDYLNSTLGTLGYRTNFRTLNENCIKYYFKYCYPNSKDERFYVGGSLGGCLIEEVTVDQISKVPSYRAGFSATGGHSSVATIQASGTSAVCAIMHTGLVNLKIQF